MVCWLAVSANYIINKEKERQRHRQRQRDGKTRRESVSERVRKCE